MRRDRDPAAAERVVNRPCGVCGTKQPRHRPGPQSPTDDLALARTRVQLHRRLRPGREEDGRAR